MCAKIFITIATLFLVHTVHAEEKGYGLLWSYKTGSNVWGVSVSSDGTYIAAASIDKNIYLFSNLEVLANNAIEEIKKAVELESVKGFNVVEVESLPSQAEQAFNSGEYIKASELAELAKTLALEITKTAPQMTQTSHLRSITL